MEIFDVQSRAISSIGYDSMSQRMEVTFVQSGTYEYCNVPQIVFDSFYNSKSKGTHYSDYIKGRYQCH